MKHIVFSSDVLTLEWTGADDALPYDTATLNVEFVKGRGLQYYCYADVPHNVFVRVFTADSVGRALHRLVISAGYTCTGPYERFEVRPAPCSNG